MMEGLIKLRTLLHKPSGRLCFMSINCKSNATNWKSSNKKKETSLVHIFTAALQGIE